MRRRLEDPRQVTLRAWLTQEIHPYSVWFMIYKSEDRIPELERT